MTTIGAVVCLGFIHQSVLPKGLIISIDINIALGTNSPKEAEKEDHSQHFVVNIFGLVTFSVSMKRGPAEISEILGRGRNLLAGDSNGFLAIPVVQ